MEPSDIPIREAKKQIKRFRERVEEEAHEHQMQYLNITPMMDMMTIMLVFLLKQFSVQTAAALTRNLELPASSSQKQSAQSVVVTITKDSILVEGKPITPVRAGAIDPSAKRDGANGYFITPLVQTLTHYANQLKKVEALGGNKFDGTAMVMVDKTTPYRLLTEVLYSAGQAEFGNYRLMVLKKGD